jgi:hypothetical protein
MTRWPKAYLAIESLEDRWVPATVRVMGGTLLISNPTLVGGMSNVTITQTAPNSFQVVDGSKSVTATGISNIQFTGSNGADTVTLDLNGMVYTGGFVANTGKGNDTVSVISSTAGGAVNGNVTILTGAGNDSVAINDGGGGSLSIGGNIQVVNSQGTDSFSMSGANATTVGGNLQITGVANVQIGRSGAVAINGSLIIQNDLLSTPSNITVGGGSEVGATTVGKDVRIDTGSGADSVTFDSVDLNGHGGSTQISTGAGNDSMTFDPGFAGATVHGNFSLTEGSGHDMFAVTSSPTSPVSLQGNASVDLGDGDNTLTTSDAGFAVAGNLSVNLGNGNDMIGLAGAAVGGNLNLDLGNGNDTATLGNAPGGLLDYHSGNGTDSLTLTPTEDGAWNVLMNFGTGSDTLTLNGSGNQTLSGTIDFDGLPGGNALNQGTNWSLVDVQVVNA